MAGQWQEVVRFTFKGGRFQGALELTALSELQQFQKIVTATARALWLSAHPGRDRVPPHFEDGTLLWLRRIEPGSSIAVLEKPDQQTPQVGMFEPVQTEIDEVIDMVCSAYDAIDRDENLPQGFARSLVAEYEELGKGLRDEEEIQLIPVRESAVGQVTTRIRKDTHARWEAFKDKEYEEHADITGEILMVDIKRGIFQIWEDEKTSVTASFTSDQEERVTDALKEHQTRKVRVAGKGTHTPIGRLTKIDQIDSLTFVREDNEPCNLFSRPIEDVITELAREVPKEEWEKVPSDLSQNLDHYLYGGPKR